MQLPSIFERQVLIPVDTLSCRADFQQGSLFSESQIFARCCRRCDTKDTAATTDHGKYIESDADNQLEFVTRDHLRRRLLSRGIGGSTNSEKRMSRSASLASRDIIWIHVSLQLETDK